MATTTCGCLSPVENFFAQALDTKHGLVGPAFDAFAKRRFDDFTHENGVVALLDGVDEAALSGLTRLAAEYDVD